MKIAMVNRLPQESTREYVYRFLKENIMSLKLPPGSTLSEKDISNLLNVSRTPVREAFIQLSQEYLLDILPQKGTYVSLIDLENVEESRFLRETVEMAVIEIACREFPQEQLFELQSYLTLQELCIQEKNNLRFFAIDEALHGAIFSGCHKARIWSMIQQMNTHYNRVRMLNIAGG
ncbi:MAG: GntR family transcriptional regulator, partial [Smithella sp.]